MSAPLVDDSGELQAGEIRAGNRVARFYWLTYIQQSRLFDPLPQILGRVRFRLAPELTLTCKIGFHIVVGFKMRFAFHYFFSFPPA
jgi:hypothetical protein